MKKFKNTIILLIITSLLIAVFSGCSSSEEDIDFIYPFEANISSFDPQVSSTSDEFLIIENCFEGLIRVNDDGSTQAGVAKSWSISSDGMTYTFELRQGAKWHITDDDSIQELMGENFNPDITANDFVFALRRAVDKTTDSPLYSSVSNIKNAPQIHSGSMKTDKLGVKALSDYELEITLSSPDDNFLSTLSTAVAMPCNEEFFNATKGRYGLGLDYTMFNGQFYVSSILDSSYILKNNSQYVGDYPSAVSDITLKIVDESTNIAQNLESGYFDSAFISGSEYEQINSKNITVTPYSDKTWAFVINKNKYIFSNKSTRQAIALSLSDIDLSEVSYLSKATCYTPQSCVIGSESADKAIGTTVMSRDAQRAVTLWKEGLSQLDTSTADLTVIVTQEMEDYAKEFVQGIQGTIGKITTYGDDQKISFSLKIDVLSSDDFQTAIANGDYDLALYSFSASTHDPVNFLSELYASNISGDNQEVSNAIKKAQSAKASELASACRAVEKAMIDDCGVVPVLFESSYYAQAKGVSGVQFHPGSGRVCFVNAKREK